MNLRMVLKLVAYKTIPPKSVKLLHSVTLFGVEYALEKGQVPDHHPVVVGLFVGLHFVLSSDGGPAAALQPDIINAP